MSALIPKAAYYYVAIRTNIGYAGTVVECVGTDELNLSEARKNACKNLGVSDVVILNIIPISKWQYDNFEIN